MRKDRQLLAEFSVPDLRILAWRGEDKDGREKLCILYVAGGRIVRLDTQKEGELFPGDIYMARVLKRQPNLDAAFADIGKDRNVFLPGDHKTGEELPLMIRTTAYRDKLARATDRLPEEMKEEILARAAHSIKGSLLYAAERPLDKSLRIAAETEGAKWLTEDPQLYERAAKLAPQAPARLHADERIGLCELYGLRSKTERVFSNRVLLDSGAELVFAETEALCAIDVNSAKADKGRDKEAAGLLINREAAKEIAFQLKLRRIAGIVLIDFISMKKKESETILLEELSEAMRANEVDGRVEDITKLGIVELSVRRFGPSLSAERSFVNSTILTKDEKNTR
ncbi:MAG: ribonuclease E/G [Lachnospiraceae bacterium]|nr:ribonuclease E/G [Lachnospiraceae bacterium]